MEINSVAWLGNCVTPVLNVDLSSSNSIMTRLSTKGRDIEIGMRTASSTTSSQKALLEESDEE